jgi:hypothetical protein
MIPFYNLKLIQISDKRWESLELPKQILNFQLCNQACKMQNPITIRENSHVKDQKLK